jgi:glycosyltransferase involved in cell wall biosynthesis
MLRELRAHHRVTYVTLDDGAAAPDAVARAREYCDALVTVPFRTTPKRSLGFYGELLRNVGSSLPYAVWKYRSTAMRGAIDTLTRRGDLDVLVCDFLFPSLNIPAELPCPTVLFQHNVEAEIWRRHAQVASNPATRLYMHAQWRRMRAFEQRQCRRFDHVVAVSSHDRALLQQEYGITSVSAVPTGVDTEFFRPRDNVPRDPHALVFTGSMDWMPNEDAILYFAERILPRVRAVVPDATLTIVGRNPPSSIQNLAAREPSVRVVGRVPDVRPYLERAAAFVVPIRIGGGTRLKIYEAMAMEKAVVSTTVGAEGLPVRPGDHLLIADEPAQFAAAVIGLLTDPERAESLGRQAAAMVRAQLGWEPVGTAFAEICAQVVDDLARRGRVPRRRDSGRAPAPPAPVLYT